MTKYFEVDDDFDIATLGDAGAALKAYTPEDVAGLKAKANDLLGELVTRKQRAADLELEVEQLKKNPPAPGKQSEELLSLQAKLEDATGKIGEYEKTIEQGRVSAINSAHMSRAEKLANMLVDSSSPNAMARINLLTEKIKARTALESIDSDSLTVLDVNGKPTISKGEELVAEMREAYPFLADGSRASGGGAQGGAGGAGAKDLNTNKAADDAKSKNDLTGFIAASLQGEQK